MNQTANYVAVGVYNQSFQAAVTDEAGSCSEKFRLRYGSKV
ncbi:MAG: hypothetical protein QW828_06915 [Candidatus Bathyarchaeia archaeon]